MATALDAHVAVVLIDVLVALSAIDLGEAVGRAVPMALAAALLAGFVPCIALLVRNGAQSRTLRVPFAPCLALGGVLALVAGPGL